MAAIQNMEQNDESGEGGEEHQNSFADEEHVPEAHSHVEGELLRENEQQEQALESLPCQEVRELDPAPEKAEPEDSQLQLDLGLGEERFKGEAVQVSPLASSSSGDVVCGPSQAPILAQDPPPLGDVVAPSDPDPLEDAIAEPNPAPLEDGPIEGPADAAPAGEVLQVAAAVPEVPAPKAAPGAVVRAGGARVHSTPALLKTLEPNSELFRLRLNYNDHRFTCETIDKEQCDFWIDAFRQRTFSRGFVNRDWKLALQEVHEYMWQKFNLQKKFNLQRAAQVPGQVPPTTLENLASVIADMPPPKEYSRR